MNRARLLLGLLSLAGCSSGPLAAADARPPDRGLELTEAGLARCPVVGERCIPADPCGLNARCDGDHLCRPEGRRDCDDGVECTEDRCVPGGCENRVRPGRCLIEDSCRTAGQAVACGRCDPAVSTTAWTPVSGTSCDDGNPCTKGDQCRQGVCVGQLYSCTDGLSCTTDACDGAGRCDHTLKSGFCLVGEACYQAQQTDPSGCQICDPGLDPTAFTPRLNICTIGGACQPAGALDPAGCKTCDPSQSKESWTALTSVCTVGDGCVAAGTKHPSGCAVCDPKLSTATLSAVPGASLSWTAFSAGLEGYQPAAPAGQKGVGWQHSTARAFSPPGSLYYGDPLTKSYATAALPNSGTVAAPTVTLPASQRAFLSFQLYLDVEKANDFDVLTVRVNGKDQWVKSSSTVPATAYKKWLAVLVELTPFAGQAVTVEFAFDTKDGVSNATEGVYLDDVTLLTGCGKIL